MTDDAPGAAQLRELHAQLDRPIQTDDDDHQIPVAATVLLVRDGEAGLEVFMIERPDRGSFAGAWVFPGGKVEDQDGDGAEADVVVRAAVRETLEETALVVDPAALVPFSRWVPPRGMPLRIRTWFFLAPAPVGEVTLQEAEALTSVWVRPADMLERHAAGAVTLYPPTWVSLHTLAAADTVDDLLGLARLQGLSDYASRVRRRDGATTFLWQPDVEFERDVDDARGPRHRLDTSSLPWRFERSDD